MKNSIFIFAYYSFKDPVFQSAVLPYFLNFPEKNNFKFILLTFEQKKYKLSQSEIKTIQSELNTHNIYWYHTKWNSGKFKVLKKGYDLIKGILISTYLILKHKSKAIYSEGFPGGIISHIISKITFKNHIIHTFEPHTDYMIEAGVWNKNSWEAKLLVRYEKKVANHAHHIFTATSSYKEIIHSWGIKKERVSLAPSCVDTTIFQFNEDQHHEIRNRYGITPKDIVITYLGKFGGMYTEREFFEFAKFLLKNAPEQKFHFWIFTGQSTTLLNEWMKKLSLDTSLFMIKCLTRDEVPNYLSASNYGFVGVKQYPSKRFCSPIKDGEYWACGLAIIIPKGVSDDYILTEKHKLGYVLDDFSEPSYKKVLDQILSKENLSSKEKIIEFVHKNRSIDNFKKVYFELLNA